MAHFDVRSICHSRIGPEMGYMVMIGLSWHLASRFPWPLDQPHISSGSQAWVASHCDSPQKSSLDPAAAQQSFEWLAGSPPVCLQGCPSPVSIMPESSELHSRQLCGPHSAGSSHLPCAEVEASDLPRCPPAQTHRHAAPECQMVRKDTMLQVMATLHGCTAQKCHRRGGQELARIPSSKF